MKSELTAITAHSIIKAENEARAAKTAQLREARLAKEAAVESESLQTELEAKGENQ